MLKARVQANPADPLVTTRCTGRSARSPANAVLFIAVAMQHQPADPFATRLHG